VTKRLLQLELARLARNQDEREQIQFQSRLLPRDLIPLTRIKTNHGSSPLQATALNLCFLPQSLGSKLSAK
jgi:hypothetical protein